MAASSWLSLGPIGTGALGLLVLGSAGPAILGANGLGSYANAIQGVGLIGAVLLWGYGVWWFAMAVLITLKYLRDGLPFNMGWWGYTFPLGVYTLATLRLHTVLPIGAFSIYGGALVVMLAVLWAIVGARTLAGAWHGDLFAAPCLAGAARRRHRCREPEGGGASLQISASFLRRDLMAPGLRPSFAAIAPTVSPAWWRRRKSRSSSSVHGA